jgi:hypothetical protein
MGCQSRTVDFHYIAKAEPMLTPCLLYFAQQTASDWAVVEEAGYPAMNLKGREDDAASLE